MMGYGDEVMVAGIAAKMQQTDPRRVRVLYDGHPRWSEMWDHNPRIALLEDKGDVQILHARQGALRPYIESKTGEKWNWRKYGPPHGEMYLSQNELEFGQKRAGRLILEPHIKVQASRNKDWGWIRWSKLSYLLNETGHRYTQLGPRSAKLLDMADWLETQNIRQAAAVIAYARLVVTHEGAFHHLAAAFGTPCIVIYGGFISPEVTGYADQVNLFSGEGLGCGMRLKCDHCDKAMAAITPEHVFGEIKNLIHTKVAA